MFATVKTPVLMYLRVKKWLLLYQYCLRQKKHKKDEKGSEWFPHDENQTVCMSSCRVPSLRMSPMSCHMLTELGGDGLKHYVPFFFAIIYIKYDLHDIAFFLFFLNATISFFFSTLCFCALDFTWQVAQEHVRCWKQVPRKWFRQIHSGSDLTGDRTCHKLSVTLATRRLGKHTGIVQFCFFFKKGKGCIF